MTEFENLVKSVDESLTNLFLSIKPDALVKSYGLTERLISFQSGTAEARIYARNGLLRNDLEEVVVDDRYDIIMHHRRDSARFIEDPNGASGKSSYGARLEHYVNLAIAHRLPTVDLFSPIAQLLATSDYIVLSNANFEASSVLGKEFGFNLKTDDAPIIYSIFEIEYYVETFEDKLCCTEEFFA